jgi:hypothetical protein
MPKLPAPKTTAYVVELERLRRALPLRALLQLMTQSALTGQIPILDLYGKPTGQFKPLRPDKQIDLAMSLINKALPDRPEQPVLPEDASQGKTIDVRNLSDEELEALAVHGDTKDACLLGPRGGLGTPGSIQDPGVSDTQSSAEPRSPSEPGTDPASRDDGASAT